MNKKIEPFHFYNFEINIAKQPADRLIKLVAHNSSIGLSHISSYNYLLPLPGLNPICPSPILKRVKHCGFAV